MGVYTPSDDDLLVLLSYLQSQRAKGLPPRISSILDNMETSHIGSQSHGQFSGSSAYPQPESPPIINSSGYSGSSLNPASGHPTYLPGLANDVSLFFYCCNHHLTELYYKERERQHLYCEHWDSSEHCQRHK